jgi:hypothetical protein
VPGPLWFVSAAIALAGLAALFFGMSQTWFAVELGPDPAVTSFLIERLEEESKTTGWGSYDSLDIVLVVVSAIALIAALVPVKLLAAARAGILLTVGVIIVVIVAWRLGNPPGSIDVNIESGIYISLAGGIAVIVAGAAAIGDALLRRRASA